MKFKIYSQTRPDLKEKVYPKLELRSWNEVKVLYSDLLEFELNNLWGIDVNCIVQVQEVLHKNYRRINFDFPIFKLNSEREYYYTKESATSISLNESLDEFFFYELLSLFFDCIGYSEDIRKINLTAKVCEDIFYHFGVNMMIRNSQFVPRQSEKIVTEIYDPTFDLLNDSTYDGVNNELNKAFGSFRAKDYNDVIIKSINAVQAALQILVDGEVNQKKKINVLLKEAKNNQLLSDYELTNTIYLNINSFLERIRKDKAGVHPTNGSAYQSDALFVLNLTMVLLQNLILNNNSKKQG